MKVLLLLVMIFMHIVDDYYLQGILASLKQKSYWEQNAPDKLYKYDYLVALFMHSFSWSFMIMIVPSLYLLHTIPDINNAPKLIIYFFIINLMCHMLTDNAKANLKIINLIVDQSIHLIQIIVTWSIFVLL